MQNDKGKIVILGAGPCGLGAAWRLRELGYDNWEIHDRNEYIGGLSASFVDDNGFTWDVGGHVLFSHYDYFNRLMEVVIPEDQWLDHERESWIWMRERFIPYPLQYNIGRLPEKDMMECLAGLMKCRNVGFDFDEGTFHDWIMHFFGEGIAKHFLVPYNKKVWAYPPEDLDAHWIGERVAVPDLNRIMNNIINDKDDCSWGPNNTFSFPLHGGTGEIWRNLARKLPQDKIHLSSELGAWDAEKKLLRFENGREEAYDHLISTIPLNQLLQKSARDGHRKDSDSFVLSASNIIGVGLKGEPPERLRTKCWMYFPEDDNPFYRVTVFSNYSYNNVPGKGYWSLMGEVSESPKKHVDQARLLDTALEGFVNTRLIENVNDIVATWTFRAEYAYPTPFLGRDKLLDAFLPALKQHDVYSRGRFGGWKYECGNMDHVLMQGVEAVEHILFGTPEITLQYPSFINTHRIR